MKYYVSNWNKELNNIYFIFKVDEAGAAYTFFEDGKWREIANGLETKYYIEIPEEDVVLAML